MHGGARLQRSAREPPGKTQGIQIPAAAIQHRQPVAPRPRRLIESGTLQQFHRRAAARQLLRGDSNLGRVLRPHCCAQGAVAARVAANVMPLDEIEYKGRRGAGEGIHAAAQLLAEVALHRIRIELQAGIDLAAIAAGGAPARLLRLEQHDLRALLRQMQSGRQSGDAAADHGRIGAHIPVQRRRRDRGFRGILV